MPKANSTIRNYCKENHIRLFRLGRVLNLSPSQFSMLLTDELPSDESEKIMIAARLLSGKGDADE